jgi:hypothetical protein
MFPVSGIIFGWDISPCKGVTFARQQKKCGRTSMYGVSFKAATLWPYSPWPTANLAPPYSYFFTSNWIALDVCILSPRTTKCVIWLHLTSHGIRRLPLL